MRRCEGNDALALDAALTGFVRLVCLCVCRRTYGFVTFCFFDQRMDAESKLRDLVRLAAHCVSRRVYLLVACSQSG